LNLVTNSQLNPHFDPAASPSTTAADDAIAKPAPVPLIIAVDDEIDDILVLKTILKRAGVAHRFQQFSNGDAAILALTTLANNANQAGFPLVCLLDIKMTGMTGLEVLKWIRSQRPLDALPVIMFSGSDDPRDLANARELGAQSYVKKFPSPAVMKQLLEEAERFASVESPKQGFRQWHYRFIENEAVKVPTLV
jgi:chemotaxis family two-component system response regulator Rcp1